MAEFSTLLFDADQTLFDFDACEREALEQTFEKYGYPLDEQTIEIYTVINKELWKQYELGRIDRNTVIYRRFGELFRAVGIKDDGIAFEDDYQRILGEQHILIEDAMEVIENLYEKYDLYIVTNGVTATQLSRLKKSGVDRYIKDIFVSEHTGYQKPMKQYFDYCFERIGNVNLNKTMIIGDSLTSDIRGGNNAGIATCWYNPSFLPNDIGVIVDYEIHKLKELYSFL